MEESIIKDETYGFNQSGFINISIPDNISEEKSILKIVIFSDDIFLNKSLFSIQAFNDLVSIFFTNMAQNMKKRKILI